MVSTLVDSAWRALLSSRLVTGFHSPYTHRALQKLGAAMICGLVLALFSWVQQASAAITVDGHLETDYTGAFVDVSYTRDQGGTFTGRIAVVDSSPGTSTGSYFIGFTQAVDAKSNAYCPDKKNTPNCFQTFNNLLGSDFISFEWIFGSNTIYVPVDILRSGAPTPSEFEGIQGGGDGGSISGINPASVSGRSGMDYNLNVLGWFASPGTPNPASPNFTPGQESHPYDYSSVAEVGLDKAALTALGIDTTNPATATALAQATVVVHNSPAAPSAGVPVPFIECPQSQGSGTAGGSVSVNVKVTEDGQPLNAAPVLAFVVSGPGSITWVEGTPGSSGVTGPDGIAEIIVTSSGAGTTEIRAVHDVDGDGVWDQGSDPETTPLCPIVWSATAISYDLAITKSVDVTQALRGNPLLYTMKVTNTGQGTLTNLVVSDAIPAGTNYLGGSATGGGVFDSASDKLTWSFASLDPGASMIVSFKVTIKPGAPAQIVNVAIAKADQAGPKEASATTVLSGALGAGFGAPIPATGAGNLELLIFGLAMIGAGDVMSSRRVGAASFNQ